MTPMRSPYRIVQANLWKEPNHLKPFRRQRPLLTDSDGRRLKDDAWKKNPLNRSYVKPLSDKEIRKIMRSPTREADPYDRLEFFERGDLEPGIGGSNEQTAMPIDEPEVVPSIKAREYVLRKLETIQLQSYKDMLNSGEMTAEQLITLKEQFDLVQEHPELEHYIQELLYNKDDVYVDFPKEIDDQLIDRSQMSFVDQLTYDYNVPGYIEFEEIELTEGAPTPIARLSHCNGEELVISLHGGCIVGWLDENGKNRLFNHPEEKYDIETPIGSSGINFAFPQFGPGKLPFDGVVNKICWDVVRTEIGADWLPDPAPSITLFCKDTEETRKIWDNRFEIYNKITLGETDDFPEWRASTKEQRQFQARVEEAGSVKLAMEGLQQEEEEIEEAIDKGMKEQGRSNQRSQSPVVESSSDDSPSTSVPEDFHDPIPNQIRMQIAIVNKGDKPMQFQCGLRTHLVNKGIKHSGEFIHILGLGGRMYLDYNLIPGKPILRMWNQDYVVLGERDLGWDAIFTENNMNDVFFCPGTQTYFESINRKGFPDVLLYQPGPNHPDHDNPIANRLTMMGRGRVTVPVKLEPGEKWEGEYVLRYHDHFYEEPCFGYQDCYPPPDEDTMDKPPPNPIYSFDVR